MMEIKFSFKKLVFEVIKVKFTVKCKDFDEFL